MLYKNVSFCLSMIIWLVVALLVGVLLGTFTGLFPGIHINLVAATLLASLGYFSRVEPIVLVVFIVAMAITHTFVDFIPSVFLGAPEEDSFLAVLPGHQLLIEGRGFEAIVMTLYGGLAALPIVLVFSFAYVLFLPGIYEIVRIAIPYLLILVSLYLVLAEEEWILSGAIFRIGGADCYSNEFPLETGGGAPMPYCLFFHGGAALHGSTLSGFINRSGGCV